jgi:multiple sugar transport system substrate-binding protein
MLAGCTQPPPAVSPISSPNPTVADLDWGERGPITFAAESDFSGTTAEAIATWNSKHPGEEVTLYELPTDPMLRYRSLKEQLDEKSGEFTVAAVDYQWLAELAAAKSLTEAPSDLATGATVVEQAAEQVKWNAKVYAVPYTLDAGVLYYRKDLLGAQVVAPTTLGQLESICDRQPTRAGPPRVSRPKCYVAPFASGEDFTVSMLEGALGNGGQLLSGTGENWETLTQYNSGLQHISQASKAGYLPLDETVDYSQMDARRAFASGEVLFYRDWGSAWSQLQLPSAQTGYPQLSDLQIGVARLAGTMQESASVRGGQALAFSQFGRNLGTANSFAQWLTSPQMQLERFEKTGQFPVDMATLASIEFGLDQRSAVVWDAIEASQARPSAADYAQLSEAVNAHLRPAVQGEKAGKESIASFQNRVDEIIAQR